MPEPYEYRCAGRSRFTVISLGLTIAGLGLAAIIAAPPGTLIAWTIATGFLAWHILANPEAGTRIDDEHWVTYRELRRRRIRRRDIAHVEVSAANSTGLTLVLHDGQRLRLAAACLPPVKTLVKRLQGFGIDTRMI